MNSAAELRRQAYSLAAIAHSETLAALNHHAIHEAGNAIERMRAKLDEAANQITDLCAELAKQTIEAADSLARIAADPTFSPTGAPWAIHRAKLSTKSATFGVDVSEIIDIFRSIVFNTDGEFQNAIDKICQAQRAAGDAYQLTVSIIDSTPAADLPGLLDELKGGDK